MKEKIKKLESDREQLIGKLILYEKENMRNIASFYRQQLLKVEIDLQYYRLLEKEEV